MSCLHQVGREQVAFLQGAQDRLAQRFHMLLAGLLHIHFVEAVLTSKPLCRKKSERRFISSCRSRSSAAPGAYLE